jgi:ribosome production factor 2
MAKQKMLQKKKAKEARQS